ncbi:MAG: hypothetical protein N2111_14630 [Candidatus Sumerlaeaceae bacterium]|nr:hypothetical protein [Candidatus Sumerlaeaceae bacterium]
MKSFFFYFVILFSLTFCSKEPDLFPKFFLDLNLTKKLVGTEAKDFVNRLHYNKVTEEKNEIGFYSGPKGSAIIYITFYNDKNSARTNYEKMIRKISPENSVFTKGTIINFDGKEIYKTFGMGQTHYVFASSNKLFWISAEISWAEKFLNEYLKILD